MRAMKTYVADVFDYATKGYRRVAVVAPNRKEAVLAFNGQERGGKGYTGRIEIHDLHPISEAAPGVVFTRLVSRPAGVRARESGNVTYHETVHEPVESEWEPLRSAPFTFPGAETALAHIIDQLDALGFESASPAVDHRQPERRWFRRSDRTLVVLYSPMSGLPARLVVSWEGYSCGVAWGQWDALPTVIARIEAHRAAMVEAGA